MPKKKTQRQAIFLNARKLVDVARDEGVDYRTAQRNKDRFACVIIALGGVKDKNGKEKPQKYIKRYLDARTTELLQASGLYQ